MSYAPPPDPPPLSHHRTGSSTASEHGRSVPARSSTLDAEPDSEAPPAYSATADEVQEQSLEHGVNPFRPVQHHPSSPRPAWQPPPQDWRTPPPPNISPYPMRPPLPGQPPPALPAGFRPDSSTSTIPRPPLRYEPATKPINGQPLLREGRILHYPRGFVCPKCHSTGFKSYDPTHPCKTCWQKYSQPMTSALRISLSSVTDPPREGWQRPLPSFSHQPPYGPAPSQPPGAYPTHLHQPPSVQLRSYNGYGPPPGALVVRPGDPRIGGALCRSCGGEGSIPCGFLMLDTETCLTCGGCGRVF
ncbi:uncharacterized protein L969DRAFT_90191 [Mixia osmundae IAM 14324]|uniref:Uncharacterized protein n=1 Tax=Mixia osmundae (strain CBS 9802 / IAM 14324 / JCM 22182 / KY 12970) TaxID=764103 RepID=G7DSW2_MIXOS|nr:uncharacterized protein L969DRAFT_90191 [Mixia osmundae IAM 14324]KEI37128.1 hypothetical protein L969DRAFT_90191 [Mixia osmundae IAM 14324]GAA93672.1 hypothetical protein E5Q_00317 [Mixia osmundae IAM 14324]